MRYTQIAISKPFEGKPNINMADIFGASAKKPVILKIPVTGKRPVKIDVKNLPAGLKVKDGVITGAVQDEGIYDVLIIAENELGRNEKKVSFEISADKVLLTPLMGFTSWNAFGSDVTQKDMTDTAKRMIGLGICEYGYGYINTDSGWQKEYGGKYDAIMPNKKFPDMKQMCDEIHSLGLKCGIYSTPMRTAWGCPKEFKSIPGCTAGEADERFSEDNGGGIGLIRKEKNNALQWAEWGFDYLKYDWSPTEPYNADLMRKELKATNRDFGMSVTVWISHENINYWKKYVNSYRRNPDASGNWDNLLTIYRSKDMFIKHINKGHFFDMDMLDVGTHKNKEAITGSLTEDEQLVAYSMRAFFSSPIQISSTLEDINEFELSMYCNEEIIAINQDIKFDPPRLIADIEDDQRKVNVYMRDLSDGGYAIAVFNMGTAKENVTVELDKKSMVRDVWKKEDIGEMSCISIETHPHTVRIFKVSI